MTCVSFYGTASEGAVRSVVPPAQLETAAGAIQTRVAAARLNGTPFAPAGGMPTIRRILVPTDFSPSAQRAADYAAELARQLGASITLYNVYTLPVTIPVFDGSAFPTASGVNPMVTIEALAHMNSRALAAKLA